MGKVQDQKEWDRLASKHDQKLVVTAWYGSATRWFRTAPGRGVWGRICGWGADGPEVIVDESLDAPARRFYPGGSPDENWGCGRTWVFGEMASDGKQ